MRQQQTLARPGARAACRCTASLAVAVTALSLVGPGYAAPSSHDDVQARTLLGTTTVRTLEGCATIGWRASYIGGAQQQEQTARAARRSLAAVSRSWITSWLQLDGYAEAYGREVYAYFIAHARPRIEAPVLFVSGARPANC